MGAGVVDKTSCTSGKLARDTFDTSKRPLESRGKAGVRGQLTRTPHESGSLYGLSVYVDKYALWADRFQG